MLDLNTRDRKKIFISTCLPGTDSLIVSFFQGKTKWVSLQSGWSMSCKVMLGLTFLKKHLH